MCAIWLFNGCYSMLWRVIRTRPTKIFSLIFELYDERWWPATESPPESDEDGEVEVPKSETAATRKTRGRKGKSSLCKCQSVDLSWVGNVIELKDGDITVLWADGSTSKVLLSQILPCISILCPSRCVTCEYIRHKLWGCIEFNTTEIGAFN